MLGCSLNPVISKEINNMNSGVKRLIALFEMRIVLTLKMMKRSLKRCRASVVKYLVNIEYCVSYNAAGKYYTLKGMPSFDSNGIWKCGDAYFSKYGTLRETVIELVKRSPNGYTHAELRDILGIRMFNTLQDLVEDGKIKRREICGTFVYFSLEHDGDEIDKIRNPQDKVEVQNNNVSEVPKNDVHTVPQPETSNVPIKLPNYVGLYEIVEVLTSFCNGNFNPEKAYSHLQQKGINITFEQVESVFSCYDLKEKISLSILMDKKNIINFITEMINTSYPLYCDYNMLEKAEKTTCEFCGSKLVSSKTSLRHIQSIELGFITLREQHRWCPNGCIDPKTGKKYHTRGDNLSTFVKPGCNYAYDFECYIGRQIFLGIKQVKEVHADLQSLGYNISESEVIVLRNRFLQHVEDIHLANAPLLLEYIEAQGGYVAHIDATCEAGRGGTYAIYAGGQKWVLVAGKIESENSEYIAPILQKAIDLFGIPIAFVRDMGKAMTKSIENLILNCDNKPPELVCHYHVGKDIGKDILNKDHEALMLLFRSDKVRPDLNKLLGNITNDLIGKNPQEVEYNCQEFKRIPNSVKGLNIIKKMLLFLLDFRFDESKKLFPFTRPYLEFFNRCCSIYDVTAKNLARGKHVGKTEKYMKKILSILEPIVTSNKYKSSAESLTEKAIIFDQFREALKLDTEGGYISKTGETEPDEETLNEMKETLNKLLADFETNKATMNENSRKAVDIILSHMEKHGKYLWGHRIETKDKDGNTIIVFAYRTNNCIEVFWRRVKHDIRRRSGCADVGYSLDCTSSSICYIYNLLDQNYLDIIYGGSLDNLKDKFALYDLQNNNRLAGNSDKQKTKRRITKSDKKIIRSDEFKKQLAELASA
jgi:hypothetical protein